MQRFHFGYLKKAGCVERDYGQELMSYLVVVTLPEELLAS